MQVRGTSKLKNTVGKSRLKRRKDFLRVQRTGVRFKGRFVIFIARNTLNESGVGRFGLVASKTTGKAHDRNKIKRRFRHLISLFPHLIERRDLVLLATSNCCEASFDDLRNDFENASRSMKPSPSSRGPTKSKSFESVKINQGEIYVH